MARSPVFRIWLRLGFATALVLTLSIGGVSLYALRFVIDLKDDVISQHTKKLLAVQQLRLAGERDVSDSRAFLLTMDDHFLHRMMADRGEFSSLLKSMSDVPSSDDDRAFLKRIQHAHDRYVAASDELAVLRQQGNQLTSLVSMLELRVLPEWGALRAVSDSFLTSVQAHLITATALAGGAAGRMTRVVILTGAGALLLAAGVFVLGSRTLSSLAWAEQQLRALNEDLERRVRERTARLDESLRELESYSYTVAHDLRAPLRAMTAFSQLLLEDCEGKKCPTCTDFKRRIEESARRMDRLTLDLLAYSRLSREEFILQPVELGPVLEKAMDSLEKSRVGSRSSLQIRGTLPAVMGQEVFLLQVLENLLSNAFKFVASGVVPQVVVTAEGRGTVVRVWIEDNGIGIPAEYHDRIFGIFERLNRAEDYPGTGIGLAIVRKAMHRMGGSIGFESEVKRGSRFWIELDRPA